MFSAARELRFPPEEQKKQGATELHGVQLCVLVMTTMHTINKPPKEPCRVESSHSKETNKRNTNFGLQSSQVRSYSTRAHENRSTLGWHHRLDCRYYRSATRAAIFTAVAVVLTTAVPVCFWGVAECAACVFVFLQEHFQLGAKAPCRQDRQDREQCFSQALFIYGQRNL